VTLPEVRSPLEGTTVMIVDDHRIFAEVIASRLTVAVHRMAVHRASKIGEARVIARAERPDLAIVDYKLAGECGLDLIPHLRVPELDTDVLVVSASRDPHHIIEAFERGAQAWVDKTAPVEELLDAMTAVRGGDMYLSSASVRPFVDSQLRADRRKSATDEFTARCTERELDVLRHLMAGLTRGGVAGALGLSTNTVRTHVQNLLRTYDVHSTLALVAAAREAGVPPALTPPIPLVRLT
jgi:two-component system nitrate/nitrite response regulator NarL